MAFMGVMRFFLEAKADVDRADGSWFNAASFCFQYFEHIGCVNVCVCMSVDAVGY